MLNKMIKQSMPLLVIVVLIGCKSPQAIESKNQNNFQRLASVDEEMNQTVSEQVKKIISQHKQVTNVYAINTFQTLVVGFDVQPFARFRMKKINEQFTKQINQMYPMYETIISTDQKIIWELKKIEDKLSNENATVNDIQIDIKRLIKLSKDNA